MAVYNALKDYFGYDEFKKGQEALVRGSLSGQDVLGIMPTGGGKSLCYQLPAILLDGITLVISPLIALMKDQVDSLDEVGVRATFLNSTLDDNEYSYRINEIKAYKYKIVYIAPERLNSYSFLDLIKDLNISLIAIDEAHCISQWGHDFRPSYKEIPTFINSLEKRPPVSAYTATATRLVVEEIKDLLELQSPIESIVGFDRPNLFYEVVKTGDKLNYLVNTIKNKYENNSGIVYCATRKTVESLTENLKQRGINAIAYHGGMDTDVRRINQDDFTLNEVPIIVATNAFGMGIDKPDIRFVIHYNMPQNMEAYYQEAGRAGRDGESSDCILMFSPQDIVKQKLLIENSTFSDQRANFLYENLQYLVDYCNTNDCLRGKILEYFGEGDLESNCKNCGNCLDESEMVDITLEAQKILSCIYRVDQRYGMTILIQVLRGSKNKRILDASLDRVSTYGIMKEYSENALREIVMTLISKGFVYVTADKYPILKLTSSAKEILRGEERVYHKKHLIEAGGHKAKNVATSLENYDEGLYLKLRDLRYSIAKEKELPPFMIFHDSTLKEMAIYYPLSQDDMLKVKGVGLKKLESYGEEFLQVIKKYCDENGIESRKALPPRQGPISKERQSPNKDRYLETYHSYIRNKTLTEISKDRGYKENTIIEHLIRAEKMGLTVEWDRLLSGEDVENKVLNAIKEVGLERLKPIKEILPEDISYEDIRLVIAKNTRNKG